MNEAPDASARPSRGPRRALLALLALPVLLAGAILALGLPPFAPDVPPAGATIGNPGGGGIRRPFPEMKLRAENPPAPARAELGRLLFFDPILSGNNEQSCATCHHPDLGFSDGRFQSMGFGGTGLGPDRKGGLVVRRNAPTIWNAAYNHKQFWDGRAEDLEDQARFPITSPDEMNQNPEELVAELKRIPEYARLFQQAFPSGITFENVTLALAAFERTLLSANSAFDRYAAGDVRALTAEQRRGLTLFRSIKTRCFECHGFPTFANPDFKVLGVPSLPGQKQDDFGRGEIVKEPAYQHAFKVPTLRNVALTPPFMHNGRFQTLEEVIDFYANGAGHGSGRDFPNIDDKIRRFPIKPRERRDLIAFLYALTDESRKPPIPERVPSGLPVVARATPAARASAAVIESAPPSPPGPPRRDPKRWVVSPGESIQAALDQTIAGDTVEIRPGTYRESLLIDVDNLTLRGLTENGQRPILDGEFERTDAVIASGHQFTIENLVVRNYANNGITVHGAKNVVFRNLAIESTGLYGVYPVECQGVLIEGCTVAGISDAGIYVGQSRDILVRNNECRDNVAGIEIENSVHSLVENNFLHDNTAGLLVFLLPNNPSKVGSDHVVRGNRIVNNNHRNFGDKGAIVGKLVPGMGILLMAADRTQVTENLVQGNDTFGIAVVGLALAFPKGRGFDVGVLPEANRIWNNRLLENGRNPDGLVKQAGARNCDLFWDGSGWDNSFEQPGARGFPALLPRAGWPDVFRRAYARSVAWLRDRGL